MSIPKTMQEKYDEIASIITPFSDEHLNDEFKEICLHALEKLCRKRPSPLLNGRARTWAAGIVYAIGSNNFIFDRSQPFYMPASDIADGMGVAKSTCASKASEISKMLGISFTNYEWVLPSLLDRNPTVWLVEFNGMIIDARTLPLDFQIYCHQKGYIPYVPALKSKENK